MYMDKIAVGPEAAGHISLDATIEENIAAVAKAKNKEIEDVVVSILDRERHEEIIQRIRATGARIRLIGDGDVAGAINTAFPHTGIDILLGSGGAPEGVLAAVALKCLGGELQGRLLPADDAEIERCKKMGIEDPSKILMMDDLVAGDDCIFAATGVTDSELMKGVQFTAQGGQTHSVVMRAKSGTVRFVEGIHSFKKKPKLVIK